MSNRLESTFRLPLIPDPERALRAGMAFTLTRAHAERVMQFGAAVVEPFRGIRNILFGLERAFEQAWMAKTLFALSDEELARRGLQRSGIPTAVWKVAPARAQAG